MMQDITFRVRPRLLAPVLALMVAAVVDADAQRTETRTLRGDAAAIYNIAGVIRAEAGSGNDITVSITRRGSDGSKLEIADGRIGNTESLRIIYPSDRIVYRGGLDDDEHFRTTLYVREDGTFYDSDGSRRGRRITISDRGPGLDASADIVVRVPRGRRLSLFLAAGKLEIANVEGDILGDVGAAAVDVTGTKGRLRLDTGSGRVRVRDAQGDLDLDTGSGSVELERVKGSSLRLDSGAGSVHGRSIEIQDMNLDTGSGSIELLDLRTSDLRLDSGSGSVRLGFIGDVENVRIDAGSGSVTIAMPETLGAVVDISTGSGGIDTDFPLTVQTVGRNRLRGTVGDGKGRIEVDGGSGRIRLRRTIP